MIYYTTKNSLEAKNWDDFNLFWLMFTLEHIPCDQELAIFLNILNLEHAFIAHFILLKERPDYTMCMLLKNVLILFTLERKKW